MKICQQILLVTRKSCTNVTFQSCELFILQYTLPQSVQFVGKATLRFYTHQNLCGDHIDCYEWQLDVVPWVHGGHMTECICNWNVCSHFVYNFERQIWEGSDYQSLYPWTSVNHMFLVDTYKWLLVSFQCKFLSIQEVVELFHSPDSS